MHNSGGVKSKQEDVFFTRKTHEDENLRGSSSRRRASEHLAAYRHLVMSAFCSCQRILRAIQGCDVIWFLKVGICFMGFVMHLYGGLKHISLSAHVNACKGESASTCTRVCDWVIECVCTIHCSGLSDSLWIGIDFLSALFGSLMFSSSFPPCLPLIFPPFLWLCKTHLLPSSLIHFFSVFISLYIKHFTHPHLKKKV